MSAKIDELMAQMTIREKLGQLNLINPGNGGGQMTGLGVNTNVEARIRDGLVGSIFGLKSQDQIYSTQKHAVENSRLGIPILFAEDIIHGFKNPVFPLPLGLAASWDPELVKKTAYIAAVQAAAEGLNQTYSPMIDVARDPRWGRIAEGFGEDPLLTARMGVAMIEGYQGDDLAAFDSILACAKHFAGYGAGEGGREYDSVDISPQELHTSILPPFEAASKAGVASMMTAFNDINRQPCHGNPELTQDLARDAWGFKGMFIADYTGIQEQVNHGVGNEADVAARSLKSGIDLDMVSELYITHGEKLLAEGRITEDDINARCRAVLTAKEMLGLFDDPYRYLDKNRLADVNGRIDEFRAIARQAVTQSCVLLKNDDNILPLKKSGTIAIIGPLADSRENMLGTWAVSANWNDCITIREGLEKSAGDNVNFLYARGANIVDDPELASRLNCHGQTVFIDERTPEAMRDEAVTIAHQADAVILVVGEAKEHSGEASSMTDIRIPGRQPELIKAVMATGKPVSLVVISGRPLALEPEDEIAGSILWAPFGGTESGNGIADILFGDINPSGKLPVTFPRNVGQVPIHYAHFNTGRPRDAGQEMQKFKTGYFGSKNSPLYPFGHGLSYTRFEYGPINFDKNHFSGDETAKAYAIVTNTGDRAGEEIVQLYITDPVASQTRPVRELKSFQKIALEPGEGRTICFDITTKDLEFSIARSIADTTKIWEPGEFIIQIGPCSDQGERVSINWDKPKPPTL